MRYFCDKCKLYVDECHTNCPLCGAYVRRNQPEPEKDILRHIEHGYAKANQEIVMRKLLFKILLLLSVLGVAVMVIVDQLATGAVDWSLHIIVGWILFWATMGRALFFKQEWRRQIVWDCFVASALSVYLQYVLPGNTLWSFRFAVPGIIVACIVAMSVTMIVNNTYWEHFCLPTTILCIFSLAPILLCVFVYHETFVTQYICAIVGLGIWIAMMIFGQKKYFLEVKKKFHI